MEASRTLGALASAVLLWATVVPTSAANTSTTYRCQSDGVTYTQQVSTGPSHQVRLRSNGWLQETTPGPATNPRALAAFQPNGDCQPISAKELTPWSAGEEITRLHFHFDQAELTDTARKTLANAAPTMRASQQRFIIEGHTDNLGTEPYNHRLGQDRADTVARFLVDQGVAIERLKVRSRGEAMPVRANQNSVERAENRRVDITVSSLK